MSPEVLEPEVLPPDPMSGSGKRSGRRPPARSTLLLAGLLIDVLDMLTVGPVGIRFGLLVGCSIAFVVLTMLRVPLRQRLTWSLLAGIYCTIPGIRKAPDRRHFRRAVRPGKVKPIRRT